MVRALELKIPPPLVALLCAAGMWFIAQHTLPYFLSPAMRWALVAIYVVLGIAFSLGGVLAFRQSKTTIHPMHPENASALVTYGIYRITRNPMYCGMATLLLAWAAFLQSPSRLSASPPSFCTSPSSRSNRKSVRWNNCSARTSSAINHRSGGGCRPQSKGTEYINV